MSDTINAFTSVNGSTHSNGGVNGNAGNTAPSVESLPDSTNTASTTGQKRKRESKPATQKFYAVRTGHRPGIYHTWSDCLDQVRGFPKSVFKSFSTLTEAESFVKNEHNASSNLTNPTKFYAVQSGRAPGVYTNWSNVLEQITGWKGPKHKVFKTRTEAEQFVAEKPGTGYAAADVAVDSVEAGEQHVAKKVKPSKSKKGTNIKNEVSPPPINPADYSPGSAPLPSNTEDGFDSSITLDPTTGQLRLKTADERARLKPQAVRPARDSSIRIYTDGSALGNGQNGATAGIGVYFGPADARNLKECLTGTRQTNQRAELTAIQRALDLAPRDRKVTIVSDSNYAINCCTVWFQKWRNNNWVNASGKQVENKDIISKIVDMLEERFRSNRHRIDDEEGEFEAGGHWERGPASVRFEWVKGHSKDGGNIAADELAVQAARDARAAGK